MKNILVIVQEDALREQLVEVLTESGYNVKNTDNTKEGLELFALHTVDLILLDMAIIKTDCLACCNKFKYKPHTAIILLADYQDEMNYYRCSYDDYLIKPIDMDTCLLKCTCTLEKLMMQRNNDNVIECKGIRINKNAYTIRIDNKQLNFQRKEFALLTYLVENEGDVLTRENILNTVWGYDYIGDYRVVDTVIKNIRKKLKDKSKYIQTIFRVGYTFKIEKIDRKNDIFT